MAVTDDYKAFLASKEIQDRPSGFEPGLCSPVLFPVQDAVTRWAIRRGRAAIWADTGLGKTLMQCEWARHVSVHTGGDVLILAPLAVSRQTKIEAQKIGLDVTVCRDGSDVKSGVNITNYERLHRFDLSSFSGIVLDESSILKSLDGKIRTKIIELAKSIPYRLACSATPAPNDYTEIGNHAEFLGVCSRSEMLSMFFINDTSDTGTWRLKGHARDGFWKWLCSWAVMYSKPSDLGFSDEGFELPPLEIHEHVIKSDKPLNGYLFQIEAQNLHERRESRRSTIEARSKLAAEIASSVEGPVLIWCDLNDESKILSKLIADSVEVTGSDSDEHKEKAMFDFADGKIKSLVTKPKICGWGMNFQVCSTQIFVGLSDSFESYYQAVRRCWRFGQKNTVHVHIISGENDGNVVANVKRKEAEAIEMRKEMVRFMSDISRDELQNATRERDEYVTNVASGDGWAIHLGDNVEVTRGIETGSVDYTLFSPPFSSLFTYSNSIRDMGNSMGDDEFFIHFGFLVSELFRVCRPGRLVSVHCMNLPTSKQHDGHIGLRDFRGDIIRLFTGKGFIYHSEVVIWKDPLIAAVRTKALGLMHKQLCKDSAMCRQGIPDYLVTFRVPGENLKPVSRARGFEKYVGQPDQAPRETRKKDDPRENKFSHEVWQKYASPVWWDIRQTNTLNVIEAREDKDEKHIAPLQLDVIERCIELWTNRGDLVMDPFSGIGSTGYVAVKNSRRYLGIELKKQYWETSLKNMRRAEMDCEQMPLWKEAKNV